MSWEAKVSTKAILKQSKRRRTESKISCSCVFNYFRSKRVTLMIDVKTQFNKNYIRLLIRKLQYFAPKDEQDASGELKQGSQTSAYINFKKKRYPIAQHRSKKILFGRMKNNLLQTSILYRCKRLEFETCLILYYWIIKTWRESFSCHGEQLLFSCVKLKSVL